MLRTPEIPEKRLGSIVADRYRLDALIGQGMVGYVYRGTDLQTNAAVAVKTMRKALMKSADLTARFLREPRAASAVRHPGIVTIFEAGTLPDGEVPYFVMEYVEGETLEAVAKRGGLSIEKAVQITVQVLDALAAAHNAGIVHRDLKAANVLLTPNGQTKVLDFGLIKRLSADVQSVVTKAGTSMGTPYCMSPEQVRTLAVDSRADLWAAGVLLYELLTSRPPFDSAELYVLLRDIVHTEAVPPSIHRGEIPLWLDRVILRALEKEPAARWQTAAEMMTALLNQAA